MAGRGGRGGRGGNPGLGSRGGWGDPDRSWSVGTLVGESATDIEGMGQILDAAYNRIGDSGFGRGKNTGSLAGVFSARGPGTRHEFNAWDADQRGANRAARGAFSGKASTAAKAAAAIYDSYRKDAFSPYRGSARGTNAYQTVSNKGKAAQEQRTAALNGAVPFGNAHTGVILGAGKQGRLSAPLDDSALNALASHAGGATLMGPRGTPQYGTPAIGQTINSGVVSPTGLSMVEAGRGALAPGNPAMAGMSMAGPATAAQWGDLGGMSLPQAQPEVSNVNHYGNAGFGINGVDVFGGGINPTAGGAFNYGNGAFGMDTMWSGSDVANAAAANAAQNTSNADLGEAWGGGGGSPDNAWGGGGDGNANNGTTDTGPGSGNGVGDSLGASGNSGVGGGYSANGGLDSPSEGGAGRGGQGGASSTGGSRGGGSSGGGWGNGSTGTGYDGGSVSAGAPSGGYSAAGGYDSPSESRGGPGTAEAAGAQPADNANGGWGDDDGGGYY